MRKHAFSHRNAVVLFIVVLMQAGGLFLAARQAANEDASVKSRLEAKFMREGLLIGNDIQVIVENKTVRLTGTVRTLAQKEQAGRDARLVGKGYEIENNLALAEAGLSPQQIADAINAAIEKSPSYFIFDYVSVGVTEQGMVTLKGWTFYPWSADDFVKLVQAQPGVQRVSNQIKRVLETDGDQALRLQVARLIYALPQTTFSRMNGPVHIIVNNGVVTLVGTVDKKSDGDDYERLVRINTGAYNVVNELQVRRK
jgi:osmotically-inducible protein OsmY